MLLLLADGAGGPVSWQHQRLVWENEELVADAAQQDAAVTPRQVEAPDAHLEEHVAGEDHALAVEAEVAEGMARAVEYLEAQVADRQLEPYVELQGHFAECLESGKPMENSGADALPPLAAALAVYESARGSSLVLLKKP